MVNLFGVRSRTIFVVGSGVLLAALPGCRWQVGKTPLPFPTPTPTPTPTPLALGASANDSVSISTENSIAAKVANASADFFTAATAEASQGAASVRSALSDAQKNGDLLASALPQAKKSLAIARDAYLKSEATVFLVDPDSLEELRAQPDPFGAGSVKSEVSTLDDLQSALSRLETLLDGSFDASKAADLLLEAKSISALLEKTESGLRDLADAWKSGDAVNFRSEYFLASPEAAVARIFQGLLAVTGDLLPAALSSEQPNPADIASRVTAVREIYLGEVENGPALHALVQNASPLQAALTRASVARAVALASVLEIAPDNESALLQLSPALQDVTRQLTLAANSLGIVVVSDE